MTQSLINVVNFDGVKESYIQNMKLSSTSCSSDALYIDEKANYYFIEFKNGKMDKKKVYNVHYKIYDSLLIFTDIIDECVAFCRENVDFILVYNEMKNDKEASNMQEMQEESSRVKIGKYFGEKAKKPFIRFDLERVQKLYFRRVFIYTEKEF